MKERTFTQEQRTELLKQASIAYYKEKRRNTCTFNAIGEIHCLSYASVVCSINPANKVITFYPHSDYSNTTHKHLSQFIDKELNTRIYAKERRQAIKDGIIYLYRKGIEYTVLYSTFQPYA